MNMMRTYEALPNLKHPMILSLIHACGIRRSELLNLLLSDVRSDRGLLLIRQAKGKKDRVVPLSAQLFENLQQYYVQYRPKRWLLAFQHGVSIVRRASNWYSIKLWQRPGLQNQPDCIGCDTGMPAICSRA